MHICWTSQHNDGKVKPSKKKEELLLHRIRSTFLFTKSLRAACTILWRAENGAEKRGKETCDAESHPLGQKKKKKSFFLVCATPGPAILCPSFLTPIFLRTAFWTFLHVRQAPVTAQPSLFFNNGGRLFLCEFLGSQSVSFRLPLFRQKSLYVFTFNHTSFCIFVEIRQHYSAHFSKLLQLIHCDQGSGVVHRNESCLRFRQPAGGQAELHTEIVSF